jgi:hypothetical protein
MERGELVVKGTSSQWPALPERHICSECHHVQLRWKGGVGAWEW